MHSRIERRAIVLLFWLRLSSRLHPGNVRDCFDQRLAIHR